MPSKRVTPKKSAKKKTSHYPVVLGTDLDDVATTGTNKILRVDRELSKQNHRLYRMARYYQVKIDMAPIDVADQNVGVYVLADSWTLQQAVKMAWKQYQENTSEERAKLAGGQLARWADFRVDDGVEIGGAAPDEMVSRRYTEAIGGANYTAGEFELAKVVDSAGTTRTFTLSNTPTATEFGILNEYDASGNAQNIPSSNVTGAYNALDDESDQANVTNLQEDGDLPPYNQTSLTPQNMWVKVATLGRGAAGQQRLSTGFVTAPMGLVVLTGVNTPGALFFEAKRGDYKGVHAPSMME